MVKRGTQGQTNLLGEDVRLKEERVIYIEINIYKTREENVSSLTKIIVLVLMPARSSQPQALVEEPRSQVAPL